MKLRELIREIHRRSIWQVVSVYLVGSWIALQVVQTLTTSLDLPEWFPALAIVLLIVGLPVVLATAIVQEGPPGDEGDLAGIAAGSGDDSYPPPSTPPSRPSPGLNVSGSDRGLQRWLTWRNALAGGVLVFALWGMLTAGWMIMGGPSGGEVEAASGPHASLSLAVLPLDNHTGDEGQQYLVDGMHEALIHELSRVRALTVKSRTSVTQLRDGGASIPEIVRRLGGVQRVVEGSVFQLPDSDSLRVTVQLIDATTDDHLWSREYWGVLRDVRGLQGRVSRGIVAEIEVEVSPDEVARTTEDGPRSPEAVDLYMRGRAAWREGSPESMERSISLYERALEVEPEYALAWAGLADVYLVLAHVRLPAHDAFPDARRAAERALDLDSDLAQAHAALADVHFHYDWDWRASEEGFRRALELNPGYVTAHWWYSGLLAALGRMDESVARITRARELDPASPQGHGFAVRILYYARRYEDALDVVERIRELGVSEFMTPPWAALARHALGESDEALSELRRIPDERRSPYVRTALVQVLADVGEREAARRELGNLERAYAEGNLHLPHLVAIGYTALGESSPALDWLERAAEDRDGALPWLTVDPAFDELRSNARFRELTERMGLAASGG